MYVLPWHPVWHMLVPILYSLELARACCVMLRRVVQSYISSFALLPRTLIEQVAPYAYANSAPPRTMLSIVTSSIPCPCREAAFCRSGSIALVSTAGTTSTQEVDVMTIVSPSLSVVVIVCGTALDVVALPVVIVLRREVEVSSLSLVSVSVSAFECLVSQHVEPCEF